jgi:hypothetical protein
MHLASYRVCLWHGLLSSGFMFPTSMVLYDNLSGYQEERERFPHIFGECTEERSYHPCLPRSAGHLHPLLHLNAMKKQEESAPLVSIFQGCLH